ncbi:hypothetical protein MCP_2166 [Methanocella paludicola SANAE]|uniref:Uncharacterized protein n=1 Tax=Methanocella paludicola (strain DSM 17711 / JCM 13418 / NBRC 101707 / SANAE) TaxID=304371 RepID=D1Z0L6_METPS|nr:hypothetical protein [Methanocella paludicola]BAI62238.1 hypothetical protein MCP_2166 [Methanocella paludicola SANAE]
MTSDYYFFNNSCQIYNNSLINSLNRTVGDTFFTKSAFEQSLSLWQDVPLVLAQNHPNPYLFKTDRKAALNAVNGKIVGKGTNARIEGDTLKLSLKICNPEALAYQKAGTLSLSSAFIGTRSTKDNKLVSINSVNHILLFPADEHNKPRDRTVRILNMTTNNDVNAIMNEDGTPTLLTYVRAGLISYADAGLCENPISEQLNKRDEATGGLNWDSIKKVWY